MSSSENAMMDLEPSRPLRKEKALVVIVSILLLAGVIHFSLADTRLLLAIFYLPTVLAASFFGRKGGALAGLASVILMGLLTSQHARLLAGSSEAERWAYVSIWGLFLILTGYFLGAWFDRKESETRELRNTYYGILQILNQFVSKDDYKYSHAYRVSIYASRIASAMGLPDDRVEDVRAAALLREIGQLDIGREILRKTTGLSEQELDKAKSDRDRDADRRSAVGGTLRRILPIVLERAATTEGTGEAVPPDKLPLESRILVVADVYDSLTSDRPYRHGMSPEDARDVIVRGSGREFDPDVVSAFEKAFARRQMELSASEN